MKLLEKKQHFNFFEAFSDLIFCTLVLFIGLFVLLVMNLDVRVHAVTTAEAEAADLQHESAESARESASLKEQWKKATADAEAARVEVERARREVDALQAQLTAATEKTREARRTLDRLVGTNRFTGRSGNSNILLAVDCSLHARRYWFIDQSLADRYSTSLDGESDTEAEQRKSEALQEVKRCMTRSRSYTLEEVNRITYEGITAYLDYGGSYAGYGFVMSDETSDGVKLTYVMPRSPASESGLSAGDTIVAFDGERTGVQDRISEAGEGLHELVVVSNGVERVCAMKKSELPFSLGRVSVRQSVAFNYLATGILNVKGEIVSTGHIESADNSFRGLGEADAKEDGVKVNLDVTPLLPTLVFMIRDPAIEQVVLSGVEMTSGEAIDVINAIGGRGAAVEFQVAENSSIPEWVIDDILLPTGYVNMAPLASAIHDSED